MDRKDIIQRSLDYIEAHLKTEITAAELASAAGFSVFHFYRVFQSMTGMPVMQYVQHRRLLHAVYAMSTGTTGIEAALEYGFDTYPGFYKAFLREFSCPPQVFIREHKINRPVKPNLFTEETMTITHKKAAEILKHWNLENEPVTDIYYMGTGEKNEHTFHVGDRYVLKCTADADTLKKNAALASALENSGLCTAPLIPTAQNARYVENNGLFFFLTKRLPGKQTVPRKMYMKDGAEHARMIGEILGQLHLALAKIDLPLEEDNLLQKTEDVLPHTASILPLNHHFCEELATQLRALYPLLPRQIIHRDPNPGNIMQADDLWGFIDFELSAREVRLFDPCYAATAILSETFSDNTPQTLLQWLDIYQNILLGYDTVAVLTAEERAAAPYIVLANQLLCVAWFAEQPKYRKQFEVNCRMTQWLIEHFDGLRLD